MNSYKVSLHQAFKFAEERQILATQPFSDKVMLLDGSYIECVDGWYNGDDEAIPTAYYVFDAKKVRTSGDDPDTLRAMKKIKERESAGL